MPSSNGADTIRILVSTDNHVGYMERDAERGNDSWTSFHEVMCLAKERDVDMVLLAGDLFHENKPSRKSMYQVMRSLRMNCYGEKPCELEMLSDASETFAGAFNHVNYEDPDINVAIPVFSIHGNHDDPSGPGNFAALDILQMSGLINYYGRTPEADNILIKPVLLQKGSTKLALYGMSNVRDERLFRTFRDGNVKFYQPSTQKGDWFNLMSVHQNHYAHTETGYLPEKFLPTWMDLVVWGHEHECIIDPVTNAETGFRVTQPGSSVATSLVPGEAVPKQVAILSVTGKEFDMENIRLKTVRPFVYREIALADNPEMRKISMQSGDIGPKVTRYLTEIVDEMIKQANEEWFEAQREAGEELDEDTEPPKPLIRLRVEYTAPEGGNFPTENPQRFANRFQGRVANVFDVAQFYRKRKTERAIKGKPDMPDDSVMDKIELDSVKVAELVGEFLAAQSLTILPQNTFSDAVGQFVDKDDNKAMEQFVVDSLKQQVEQLVGGDEDDDVDENQIAEMMEEFKAKMETQFATGGKKKTATKRKGSRKPKPDFWDSDLEGHWEDDPVSIIRDDDGEPLDEDDEEDSTAPKSKPARGRGSRGGRGGKAAAGTTRKTAAASKKAPAKPAGGRGKKKPVFEEEDEDDDDQDDDDDVVMTNGHDPIEIDDDEDEDDDSQALFVKPAPKKAPAKKAAAPKATASKSKAQTGTQSKLSFGSQMSQANGPSSRAASGRAAASKAPPKRVQEPSDDEIDDDDEAFEPPPPTARSRARR